jgi:cytochrome c oxidase assembly protein subunit 15
MTTKNTGILDSNHTDTSSRTVALWLFVCALMIFVMIIIGGVTRLTHSGLSMVEWKPVTGFLPPTTELVWQETFEKYQQYPEFKIKNPDMDLAGFKSIFWLEFIHRVWGRTIGIIFFVPFMFFLLRKKLDKKLIPKLITMFILGGLQGLLGWFMVKSGLSDRPDVSQYRLTAHLTFAFFLYGWILWTALGLCFPKRHDFKQTSIHAYKGFLTALTLLLVIAIMSGGFVAGTDAGFIYNTFPLMGETLLPKDLFAFDPWVKNFFENVVTIQFTHRVLTTLILFSVLGFWFKTLNQDLPERTRMALHCLLAAVILQVTLGISTLLLVVPVALAASHQAGALLLLTAVLWTRHEFRT